MRQFATGRDRRDKRDPHAASTLQSSGYYLGRYLVNQAFGREVQINSRTQVAEVVSYPIVLRTASIKYTEDSWL